MHGLGVGRDSADVAVVAAFDRPLLRGVHIQILVLSSRNLISKSFGMQIHPHFYSTVHIASLSRDSGDSSLSWAMSRSTAGLVDEARQFIRGGSFAS